MFRILQGILETLIAICSLGTLASCTLFFPRGRTVCLGTGQAPTSASYEEVPTDLFNIHTTLQYEIPSRISCAALAQQNKGHAFGFKDGNCTIYGPGEPLIDENDIFISGSKMPPADSVEEVANGKDIYAYQKHFDKHEFRGEMAVDGFWGKSNLYLSWEHRDNPFLMVDLGQERLIHQVQMYVRQNCCPERNNNYEILVGSTLKDDGDFSSYTLMSTYKGPYNDTQGLLVCSSVKGLTGRYVAFRKNPSEKENIGMHEIFVYAKKL